MDFVSRVKPSGSMFAGQILGKYDTVSLKRLLGTQGILKDVLMTLG
jgi:hypothetical protein